MFLDKNNVHYVIRHGDSLLSCLFLSVGDDPLSDSECDLDSVAGVLKLYFRGLEPPLFPYDSYSQLLECVRKTPSYKLCFSDHAGFPACFQSLVV